MKKNLILLTLMFSVLIFAGDSNRISEEEIINDLILQMRDVVYELNISHEAVNNMREILDIVETDGKEAWVLLPELKNEVMKLSQVESDIYALERLYDISDALGNMVERQNFIENVETVYDSNRATRGQESDTDKHFIRKNYEKIKGKVHEEILDLDVDFDVNLLDFDIAEGISLATKYKWGLEPSYNDGYFTRIDSYKVKNDIKIGDIIEDVANVSLPVYLNIRSGKEIIFARQFKSQKKAATALPYNPIKLPVNSENARKMNVGDFVSIPTNMSVVVGASAGFGGGISGNAKAYYMLSGDFRINILKTDKNRVRVKLIGMRRKTTGIDLSAGYSFNVFGVSFIDKQIGSFLDTNIFKIRHRDIDGENFSVDYVFDLESRDAQNAYDSFLNANLKFNIKDTANPLKDEEDTTAEFFNNLADAENIYQQDRGREAGNRRVNRIFKASNFFEQTRRDFKIGFNLIRFGRGKSYIENKLAVFDQDNIMSRYYIPVFQVRHDSKFLFGVWKRRETVDTYALFKTDMNWNIQNTESFAINRKISDKKCYARQYRKIRESVMNSLGHLAIESGIIRDMPRVDSRINDFKMNFKVLMDENSIESLLNPSIMTDDVFWNAMYNTMIDYKDELYLWVDHSNNDNEPLQDDYWRVNTSSFSEAKLRLFNHFKDKRWGFDKWRQVDKFEDDFSNMLAEMDKMEQMKRYGSIFGKEFNRTFFLRFTIEALEYAGIESDYNFKIHTRGDGIDTFNINYGNMDLNEELYNQFNNMLSNITDTSYDMFDSVEYNK
ncbi:MAG: hypothetical protein ACQESP_05305 [Candidatus Muiribacteriota bacterium]